MPIDYQSQLVSMTTSMLMLETSEYSSDSAINRLPFYKVIEDEQRRVLDKKLAALKKNIGEDLFEKLDPRQRKFLAGISGTISLGEGINFEETDDTE